MTKPDDIPQGVWDHVERAVVPIGILGSDVGNRTVQKCCRAIMAAKAEEREACANIADSKISGGYYDGAPVWADGNEIASAIRKRGKVD